uniref:Uncharacterized protein n=1 Tax=Romanomermis culicivorax TaxID=13658 RepID=A0A915JI62_ROMCU
MLSMKIFALTTMKDSSMSNFTRIIKETIRRSRSVRSVFFTVKNHLYLPFPTERNGMQ